MENSNPVSYFEFWKSFYLSKTSTFCFTRGYILGLESHDWIYAYCVFEHWRHMPRFCLFDREYSTDKNNLFAA